MGDFPMEYLRDHSGLPMDDESQVQFTIHSKNDMFVLLDAALFREAGNPQRFSYEADHPLAEELEEQMTTLIREYVGEGEYLSPHADDDQPDAHDDAAMMLALGCLGAAQGKIGSILVA